MSRTTIVIAGISSALGRGMAEALAGRDDLNLIGLYRRMSPELERVAKAVTLREFDLTDESAVSRAIGDLSSYSEDDLVFVYCCGKWSSGPVAELTSTEINTVMTLGLIAPISMTSQLLAMRRGATGRTRIILVTGLGGEKTGVRYNALYSAVTSGIYSFVRAAGMELAGSKDSCFGVALGLFDKGQPYIHDLCSRLVTRVPTPLPEIVDFLTAQLNCEGTALNGSVVELSGGLFNYQDVARLLTEGSNE